jgi:Flp pilus assembly protein CpaB
VKKKSPPWYFIGAGVLFLICVVLLYKYNQKEQQDKADALAAANAAAAQELADAKAKQVTVQETPTDLRPVLYATQPVEPGARISAAFFEKKLTPKDILPDAYTDGNDVVGWFAIRKIEKGDPLTPRNVGKSLPYMSQRITPGMRALALPVFNADLNDTGGFIVDGDRVDLLYTVSSLDDKFKINTQTVMQNVKVLYVPGPPVKTDQTDGITPITPPGDAISVTFEVTPEEAEALVFMTNVKNGKFSMILRARKDDSEVKIKPFAAADYDLDNLNKVQRTVDKSVARVKELSDEIEAKEKENAPAPAPTNETTTPIPPAP